MPRKSEQAAPQVTPGGAEPQARNNPSDAKRRGEHYAPLRSGAIPDGVTRQAVAAVDRSLPGKVSGRLKRALDAMVWQGLDRADAAVQAGMTDHSLREALRKPHVVGYYTGQCEVLRTSALAKNLHALMDVRDQRDNHAARVRAVQVLTQAPEADAQGAGKSTRAGLVIVIRDRRARSGDDAIDVTPLPIASQSDDAGD
jgi:hypothetical protein